MRLGAVASGVMGGVAGPLVAALLDGAARCLNAGRARPLTAAERAPLAAWVPPALLDRLRLVEAARVPLLPGFAGVTLGRTIYLRAGAPRRAALLAHEAAHAVQFARYGWLGMTARYGALWLRHGYAAHPLEEEARAAERRAPA